MRALFVTVLALVIAAPANADEPSAILPTER
jgi:hypothetical protein